MYGHGVLLRLPMRLALFIGYHPSVFGYPSAFREPYDAIAGPRVNEDLGHNVSVSRTGYIDC